MKRYSLSPFYSSCIAEEDAYGEYVKYSDVPQWVSVEERLPEPMTFVSWYDGNDVYPGWYDPSNVHYPYKFIDGDFDLNGYGKKYAPQSWMPLPNPPEETGDD